MFIADHQVEDFWQAHAACKGPEAVLFFAPNHFERKEERAVREARAKAICGSCPVTEQCRSYALAIREPHGIWGGMTETERRAHLASEVG